ncbi:MAG: succinate CoA transferase [Bacillota bacterium]|nr:succinate CoA transferase [Bacillota bacterium]
MAPDEAARLVPEAAVVGVSGFARAGSPKEVPRALARQARAGHPLRLSVWSGGSVGGEIDEELAGAGGIARRLPYQSLGAMRRLINRGDIAYLDQHLGVCAEMVRARHLGKVDVALVEACAIREDGAIVPTSSVGNAALYAAVADRVIVEVNLWHPPGMEGLHDIWGYSGPPGREPLPLVEPLQRIGEPAIAVDPDRIAAIVAAHQPDHPYSFEAPDDASRRIGLDLLDFLRGEARAGRLPPTLLPLQTGIGNLGNAVLSALAEWERPGLVFFSEVLQDGVLDLIDAGMACGASGTSLALSAAGQERLYRNLERYRRHLVLRPQEVSNSGEAIRRLGVIAINTAVEVDIYGHVNSTHVLGSQMLNGIGGSGDFSRNAFLSIFVSPSTARDGTISCVVPMVSHVDHTEHEVHVLITEQGVADLRGLSPRERAQAIISCCAHPAYRPLLEDYFARARRQGGHSPHLLAEALSWHLRYQNTGTMLP